MSMFLENSDLWALSGFIFISYTVFTHDEILQVDHPVYGQVTFMALEKFPLCSKCPYYYHYYYHNIF